VGNNKVEETRSQWQWWKENIFLHCSMIINIYQYYVYMLTNKGNTVIYVGVTNDVQNRTWEHKQGAHPGFTKRYACNKLVYYEEYQWVQEAIDREKQLKAGPRQKKVDLINVENPEWIDLSEGWYD
jgi:putative endonuclease